MDEQFQQLSLLPLLKVVTVTFGFEHWFVFMGGFDKCRGGKVGSSSSYAFVFFITQRLLLSSGLSRAGMKRT